MNVPPIVISPQQQQSVVVPPGYGGVGPVGNTPHSQVIVDPTIVERDTEVVRLQPRIIREEAVQRVVNDDPVYQARTTRKASRWQGFKKHYVPTFY